MALLAISDLHLNPHTAQRNQHFLDFLRASQQHGHEVLIAGDLFDLWFGWDRLTFDYQRPIIATMQDLAAAGLAMDYVEGNRDFGIATYEGKIFRSVAERELLRQWQGRAIYAVHGDLINSKDRMYRIWRALSKNRLSYLMLKNLPSVIMLRMAQRMERELKKTNLRYKSYFPENEFQRFYSTVAAADIVVIGHFHLEKEVRFKTPERDVLFYNLPGWEDGFRYLVIPPGNEKPHFADWGK